MLESGSRMILLMFPLASVVAVHAMAQRVSASDPSSVRVGPLGATGAPTRGTARSVARRVVGSRRFVAVLPRGCLVTAVGSAIVHKCGDTYYQPNGARYEIMTVD